MHGRRCRIPVWEVEPPFGVEGIRVREVGGRDVEGICEEGGVGLMGLLIWGMDWRLWEQSWGSLTPPRN